MPKHVVVVASGETEKRAIPHLVSHLRDQDVIVDEVRFPRKHMELDIQMAERLIKAAWYGNLSSSPPDKIVLLIDLDRKSRDEVLSPYEQELPGRLVNVKATVRGAYAQQHLEAWFFADAKRMREYLGQALGIDASRPDEIQNPKLHLRHLLRNRVYNSGVAEEIARELDAHTIAQRSPSFRAFLEAVVNGPARGHE